MTYVEFFDKTDSENIVACLSHAPSRVVFLGDSSKTMKKRVASYRRIFEERGQNIEFVIKTVSKSKLEDAVKKLTEIIEEYGDCAFDITGGDELLNLALGIVYHQNPDKNIQIHRFNLKNNAVYDFDKDGKTIYRDVPMLSVEENIRAYSGEILYGNVDEINTYRWEWTEDFLADIDKMWDICNGVGLDPARTPKTHNPFHSWNVQVSILRNLVACGTTSEDGLTTVTTWEELEKKMPEQKKRGAKLPWIASQLCKKGLLTQFDEGETITITFKNHQVKRCLTKEGQLLEIRVHAVARSLRDEKGEPIYQDSLSGVVINWAPDETSCITRNEIDVVMMHCAVPVFISCKNGRVEADELYKFNTVALRFGSKYAQKALVLGPDDAVVGSIDHFRQRAMAMGIYLIEDVQHMDKATFARALANLCK